MRLLGAIIAGGKSRRFGRDKAFAAIAGRPMLDHVAEALAAQSDALIVVGREWPCFRSVPDHPGPDQGPLGGLSAALHYAAEHGFDAVLTSGCDILPIPSDLATRLARPGSIVEGQPLLGLWPASFAPLLDDHLASQPDRSMRGWIARSDARAIPLDIVFHNLNTRDDHAVFIQEQAA